MIKKILSFLPALCMACVIFGFSAKTGEESSNLSLQITKAIVGVMEQVTGADWDAEERQEIVDDFHVAVRKGAHMTEYAVFSWTLLLPLCVCGVRGKKRILAALLVCVLFAAGDEYHQSFVAGRGPALRDVGFDTAGAAGGLFLAWLFLRKKNA